jgi:hypothetical protein
MRQRRKDDQPRIASLNQFQPFLELQIARLASSLLPCSSSPAQQSLVQTSVDVFGLRSDRNVPHTIV